jgi:hypothetical protein
MVGLPVAPSSLVGPYRSLPSHGLKTRDQQTRIAHMSEEVLCGWVGKRAVDGAQRASQTGLPEAPDG